MGRAILVLLLAAAPASADPVLASAQAVLRGALASSEAPGRFPRGEDPRPDRLTMTLEVGELIDPDHMLGESEWWATRVRDSSEVWGVRQELDALAKKGGLTVTVERDPSRRDAWSARVEMGGRRSDATVRWGREGGRSRLSVDWQLPVRDDNYERSHAVSLRTFVDVDPLGRITPVEYSDDGRPSESRSIPLEMEVYFHDGAGHTVAVTRTSVKEIRSGGRR